MQTDIGPVVGQGIAYASAAGLGAYHPSLNLLSDREWLVTHDVGASTESLDYHTRGLRTTDAGATWREEGPLVIKPPGIATTHTIRTRHFGDQRILGLGKWEDRRGYEQHRSNRATMGQVPMRLFWIESRDGGRSWSQPRWVDPPLVGPTWELCHAPLPLAPEKIALPVATWRDWSGSLPNGEISGMLVSSDGGQTWPEFRPTFDGRQSGWIHWEQSVIVRRDGSLLATAWVYDPNAKETLPTVFASASRDGQFGIPRTTGFLAQTCKIIELASGEILAVYRRHDQPGLWADVARVGADAWVSERRALLWGGAASGMSGGGSSSEQLNSLRFGFPSLGQLQDGSVVVVFWGSTGGPPSIRWMRIRPDHFERLS
jgi:sialidase-1